MRKLGAILIMLLLCTQSMQFALSCWHEDIVASISLDEDVEKKEIKEKKQIKELSPNLHYMHPSLINSTLFSYHVDHFPLVPFLEKSTPPPDHLS
jgi:hypothetical protein